MITMPFSRLRERQLREPNQSHPHASSVSVAGSFNEWNPAAKPLKRGKDGQWTAVLVLPPGRHAYRFVVDGSDWREDPSCADREPNAFGGFNSVLSVG
jgi:1,4-alpha-glucan branching enzyme